MNEVNEFVGCTPLLAHNASFDQKFWDFELGRIKRTAIAEALPVRCCWPGV
jgi:DNA polymerase-3 subunit epsilon